MAEGYSGETSTSTYIRMRIHYTTTEISGGHRVYAELQMRRTNSYSGATYQYPSSSSITIDGNTSTWNWTASDYRQVPANNTSWQTWCSKTLDISHTSAKSISISASNSNMGSLLTGSASTSTTLPEITPAYTAPSGLSMSIVSRGVDYIKMNVSVSSYGIPAGANGRYISAILYKSSLEKYDGVFHLESIATNASSATLTVDNSSQQTNSSDTANKITLAGNTSYKYGMYAWNTVMEKRMYSGSSVVTTVCPTPTALTKTAETYISSTMARATISWTRAADGSALTRTGYYRLSNDGGSSYGSWTSIGTITAGSGTFTIDTPLNRSIVVQLKLTTSAGDSGVKQLSYTSLANPSAPTFSNFTVVDGNSTVTDITGSNAVLVQNQSTLKFTISSSQKAVAKQGSMSYYQYTAGTLSGNKNYSSSDLTWTTTAKIDVGGTLTDASPLPVTVKAVDSIGMSTSVTKNNLTILPWQAPTISATAARKNNYEKDTTFKVSGTWQSLRYNDEDKNTLSVIWQAKQVGGSTTYTKGLTLSKTTTTWSVADWVQELDNAYAWTITIIATDKFTSTTSTFRVDAGSPLLGVFDDGRVSVGSLPTQSKPSANSGQFEVAGRMYQDQTKRVASWGAIAEDTVAFSDGDDATQLVGGLRTWNCACAYADVYEAGLYVNSSSEPTVLEYEETIQLIQESSGAMRLYMNGINSGAQYVSWLGGIIDGTALSPTQDTYSGSSSGTGYLTKELGTGRGATIWLHGVRRGTTNVWEIYGKCRAINCNTSFSFSANLTAKERYINPIILIRNTTNTSQARTIAKFKFLSDGVI